MMSKEQTSEMQTILRPHNIPGKRSEKNHLLHEHTLKFHITIVGFLL